MFLFAQSTKTYWKSLEWDKKFTQLTPPRPELSAPSPQLVSLSLKKPEYQRPNPSQLQQRLLKGFHRRKPAGPVSLARLPLCQVFTADGADTRHLHDHRNLFSTITL